MNSQRNAKAHQDYISAALDLQKATPEETCNHFGKVTFPNFTIIGGTENQARALHKTLEDLMEARSESDKKRESKKGIRDIVISCFRASYPFANLFITVAKEGSSVSYTFRKCVNFLQIPILNPYGLLCVGLLALMKVSLMKIVHLIKYFVDFL